jgi:sialidase-1
MTDQPGFDGVAAVARPGGRLDRFWVGPGRELFHAGYRDGAWAEPEDLGGRLASPPAVAAWGDEPMEVFAIFADGQLWDRYWDGTSWHPWESLGGELQPGSTPAAAALDPDRLDVIARGRDGRTWQRWWDGSQWVPWQTTKER